MRKALLIKVAFVVLAMVAFAFMFMRSIEETRTAAYSVRRAHLQSWTLSLEPASAANHPVLVLRTAPELASGLFKQIFSRAMESLNSPAAPSIPIVLRGELDALAGERMTPDALLSAARTAGIDEMAPSPRCVVHRRISEPGGVRQAYLVLFDAPAVAQFRRQLGLDADALAPVLFVAGTGSDFNAWLPQRVNAEADCIAPIEIAP